MAEFRQYATIISVIIIVFGVIPIVFAVGWIIYVLYNVKIVKKKKILPSGERESYAARKRLVKAKRFLKFQIKIAKGFFGDAIVNWRDGENGMELMIHKYRFPMWTLMFVIINEVVLVIFTLGIFFLLLLIERTFVCDPEAVGVDCFPVTRIDGEFPLLNCSDYEYLDNHSIVDFQCLKLSFNFASAAGLAGGMLEILPLFFIVLTLMILKVASGHKLRKYTTALFQVLSLLACVVILLVIIRFDSLRDYLIAGNDENYLTYVCIFGILFGGISIPWVFLLRGKHHDDDGIDEDEEERIHVQQQETHPLSPVDMTDIHVHGVKSEEELAANNGCTDTEM